MDSNRDDGAEERMLDADFANDDLESFGYHRSGSGLLVPLGHVRDEQTDVATHDSLVLRRGSRDELLLPQPGSLHEPAAEPQHPARREENERPPLKQTNNFSINVNIDGGGLRARKKVKRTKSHHDEAVDKSGPGKEVTEQSKERRGGLDTRSYCGPLCNLCTILILLVALAAVLCTMAIPASGVDEQLAVKPTGPRQRTPPSAIADSLAKLDYDARQLERRHERAMAHLPEGADLRGVLGLSTQPHLLRHQINRLRDLRARLLGEEYESSIIHDMRLSEARLRELRELAGGPTSMGAWLRAVAPRWVRWRLAGRDPQIAKVLRAERARAEGMEEEVRNIMVNISNARDAALEACQSRPRQNAQGGWVLGDGSVCRRDEGGLKAPGRVEMGSSGAESDAKAALGFINWICQDLDAMTVVVDDHGTVYRGLHDDKSGSHDARMQSLAAEAARVLEKWQDLGGRWEKLRLEL